MSVTSTFDSPWFPQIYLSIMKIYNRHYYYVLYFEAVAKVAVSCEAFFGKSFNWFYDLDDTGWMYGALPNFKSESFIPTVEI